jgi:hypothetical protein
MSGLHQPRIGRLATKFLDGENNTSNRQRSNQPTMNNYQRLLINQRNRNAELIRRANTRRRA